MCEPYAGYQPKLIGSRTTLNFNRHGQAKVQCWPSTTGFRQPVWAWSGLLDPTSHFDEKWKREVATDSAYSRTLYIYIHTYVRTYVHTYNIYTIWKPCKMPFHFPIRWIEALLSMHVGLTCNVASPLGCHAVSRLAVQSDKMTKPTQRQTAMVRMSWIQLKPYNFSSIWAQLLAKYEEICIHTYSHTVRSHEGRDTTCTC